MTAIISISQWGVWELVFILLSLLSSFHRVLRDYFFSHYFVARIVILRMGISRTDLKEEPCSLMQTASGACCVSACDDTWDAVCDQHGILYRNKCYFNVKKCEADRRFVTFLSVVILCQLPFHSTHSHLNVKNVLFWSKNVAKFKGDIVIKASTRRTKCNTFLIQYILSHLERGSIQARFNFATNTLSQAILSRSAAPP